jgi:hypothetical protein
MAEWWIEKDLEINGLALFWRANPSFAQRNIGAENLIPSTSKYEAGMPTNQDDIRYLRSKMYNLQVKVPWKEF